MFLGMVARPLMAKVKQTTGIKKVPEEAAPNLREVLIGLYSQILNEIEKLPENLTYRENVEKHMNFSLKICRQEEDVESIPSRLSAFPCQPEALIEEVRRDLSEISGLVADWQSCLRKYLPLPPHLRQSTGFIPNSTGRDLLIQLYYEALIVVKKVPENNKLRMFAESSIIRKLKVCREEDDWESIKCELNYEDPIQKAREELDHWSLFFGPDAHPNREYPHVPRTKEFCERFNAWRELTSPEILKTSSTNQSSKDTPAVSSSDLRRVRIRVSFLTPTKLG